MKAIKRAALFPNDLRNSYRIYDSGIGDTDWTDSEKKRRSLANGVPRVGDKTLASRVYER